jgi:ribose transport system substrate-binding protein
MKKRVYAVFFIFICLLALIGCENNINKIQVRDFDQVQSDQTKTGQSATPTSQLAKPVNQDDVYYLIGMHIILPYWQDHRRGLEAAAAELGVKVVFTGENGNNATRQVEIFEQIVSQNPAGILVSPIDPNVMIKPINKAIEMGIPVICIDTDSPKSNRLTYFGTDNYDSGYQAADILAKSIGNRGDVGILTIPGVFSLDERQRGFEECISKNYPNIKVVSVMNDEADPSKAANVAAQMLFAAPDLAGIFGADAASGVGSAIALRQVDKLGKVKIVAFDKDSSVLDLVEQGVIEATLVQRTFTMSYYGLKFLVDVKHENIKMVSDLAGMNPLPQRVNTGIIAVRKAEVYRYR